MKQITEDYVSYETAKLLKEKEVDFIECVTYYCEDKPKEVNHSFCGETNSTWEKRCCQAPTHQMTLKWLREVHNLHITIKPYITVEGIMYLFEIYKLEAEKFTLIKTKTGFEKSELAVEAALKEALENLI